jgi:DNA-binding transcriptional LysR family regulator
MLNLHPDGVDLLSLRAFCALMEQRSVSRAAAELGISQPTMSRLLKRLRVYLNDALLIWSGGHMVPTPRALILEPEIRQVVDTLDRISESPEAFDPTNSTATIVLAAAGHLETILLAQVMTLVAREAPRMSLEVRAPNRHQDISALERGKLDFIVGWSVDPMPTLRSRFLFSDKLVCIARRGHPALLGGKLTYLQYVTLPQVQLDFPGRTTSDLVLQQSLARSGDKLKIQFRVQSSQTLTEIVANSNLIATLPNRFARRFLAQHALVIFDLPLKMPTMQNKAFWHERMHSDPKSRWFRKRLAEISGSLSEQC